MQCLQNRGGEVANILSFTDRPVPRPVAGNAPIDKPCIKPAAVCIEPDLAAGLERARAATPATCEPRLGGNLRNDGPSDPKCIAHVVLVFRSEVHQDDCTRKPSW